LTVALFVNQAMIRPKGPGDCARAGFDVAVLTAAGAGSHGERAPALGPETVP